MDRSIVEYFSGHEGYRCGYCKSSNTFYSHGMWAHTLTPYDYQNLIDRGWRRSGKYCYKPTMHLTCCPLYSIRCETKKFILTKSQKKVLKKVHKFLSYGHQEKHDKQKSSENKQQEMEGIEFSPEIDVQNIKGIKNIRPIKQSDIEIDAGGSVTDIQSKCEASSSTKVQSSPKSSQSSTSGPSDSLSQKCCNENSNRPQCRKAKAIRQERKLQKLLQKGVSPESAAASIKKTASQPKSIEEFLSEPLPPKPAHKLELRLVPSSLENPLFCQTFEESYSIYKKYQMEIHQDPAEKCSTKQYTRFLVNSPFQTFEEISSSSHVYGSFHQQYWLDNKLIAVGVLDILPFCVSSVYFYYDPDYSFLSLGTYAALREIAFTRELNMQHSDLQYYYMGFYIHSCIKMRYKGQYVPSFLLCPETYTFHPIEKCKPKLDECKYQRLEEDLTIEDYDGYVVLKDVVILYNKKRMTYHAYRMTKIGSNDESEVREYAKLVGQKCYKRMLLYRN